jgi:hypothetical protein
MYLRDFLDQYSRDHLVYCCGVTSETFFYIYTTYCGGSTPINHPIKLYQLLLYYKLYPTKRQFQLLFGPAGKHYSRFQGRLLSYAQYLSGTLNELTGPWTDRHSPDNRLPHLFNHRVTGCIDSFPIYVTRPTDADWQYALYNGKYKGHVLKVTLICDHHGTPIWYSGPDIGTTHDKTLYMKHPPPITDIEQLLGDKGYQGVGPSVIVPFKKRRGEIRLTADRRAFNIVHRWYRATVEHTIGYIKRFRILNGLYRGQLKHSLNEIRHALNIIIHISALYLVAHPLRTHYPLLHDDSDIDSDTDSDTDSDSNILFNEDNESISISSNSVILDNGDGSEAMSDIDLSEHKYDNSLYDPAIWNPSDGTGMNARNFKRSQQVWIWWSGEWWRGSVTHVNLVTDRVNVKLYLSEEILRDLLPKHIRVYV